MPIAIVKVDTIGGNGSPSDILVNGWISTTLWKNASPTNVRGACENGVADLTLQRSPAAVDPTLASAG